MNAVLKAVSEEFCNMPSLRSSYPLLIYGYLGCTPGVGTSDLKALVFVLQITLFYLQLITWCVQPIRSEQGVLQEGTEICRPQLFHFIFHFL